jgi:hypothetical protein
MFIIEQVQLIEGVACITAASGDSCAENSGLSVENPS